MTPLSQGQALVEPSDALLRELLEVAQALREWCRAVPEDTPLPAMPGFDGDVISSVIDRATRHLAASHAAPAADLRAPDLWQWRWLNPGDNPNVSPDELAWEPVQVRPLQSMDERIAELRAYRYGDKPCYEVRALHAAAQLAAVAAPPEVPTGAIINGRAYAERLELTGLECEAGDLRMCSDWVEFRRCFEHLADWVAAVAAPDARVAKKTVSLMLTAAADLAGWAKQHGDSASKETAERLRAAALAYPGVPGIPTPSAAPLSEPCALDQGARPVRPLSHACRLEIFSAVESPVDAALLRAEAEGKPVDTVAWLGAWHGWRAFVRTVEAVEAAHGIAPPVAQQEGSTQ